MTPVTSPTALQNPARLGLTPTQSLPPLQPDGPVRFRHEPIFFSSGVYAGFMAHNTVIRIQVHHHFWVC